VWGNRFTRWLYSLPPAITPAGLSGDTLVGKGMPRPCGGSITHADMTRWAGTTGFRPDRTRRRRPDASPASGGLAQPGRRTDGHAGAYNEVMGIFNILALTAVLVAGAVRGRRAAAEIAVCYLAGIGLGVLFSQAATWLAG